MSNLHIIRSAASASFLAIAAASSAYADPVATSLPYTGTPDWTDITFGGTSMTANGTSSTLTTNNGLGVWFGYGVWYGNEPGWTLGTPAAGNSLKLTASFSAGSADWSAYMVDRSYYMGMQFNPTGCDYNAHSCYGFAGVPGVEVVHALGNDPTQAATTFLSLNTTTAHTFETLLKNGIVSYRVDNTIIYSGLAVQSGLGAPLLVIGDGSGSSPTGTGSMTIYNVSLDNAPVSNTLTVTPVPEPETYGMFLGGLGLLGFMVRRRKAQQA